MVGLASTLGHARPANQGSSRRHGGPVAARGREGGARRISRAISDLWPARESLHDALRGADAATAEDLVQDTLLTVWRRASLYASDRGSIATWVFTIARNLRIDRLRRELPWHQLPEDRLRRPRAIFPRTKSYPRRSARSGSVPRLQSCPTSSARSSRCRIVEGLSHSAIAERLGVPLGTVKSRIRIACQRIRAGARGPAMSIAHHLDDATLMSLAAGTLTPALAVVAASHVAMCPRCRHGACAFEEAGAALLADLAPIPRSTERAAHCRRTRHVRRTSSHAPRR